jgi:hypothetical protein
MANAATNYAAATAFVVQLVLFVPLDDDGLWQKKKKRGYTVCSSGYAATDTS